MSAPIRTLLIDNHPLVLDGLRAILETYAQIEVTGTAFSAPKGLELFKEKLPAARILMLSMHDSREYISTSVIYGAAG